MEKTFNEEAYLNYLNADAEGLPVRKGDDGLKHIYPNLLDEYTKDKELFEIVQPPVSSKKEYDANKSLYEQQQKNPVVEEKEGGVITPIEEPFPATTLAQEGPTVEDAYFSPYSEYIRKRQEGDYQDQQNAATILYNAIAKTSQATGLLGTSIYDKTVEAQIGTKAKSFANLLVDKSIFDPDGTSPIFSWDEIFKELEAGKESNVTEELHEWYDKNIFSRVPETEGMGAVMVEGLAQYMVPYVGSRKLMKDLVGSPVIKSIFSQTIKNAKLRKVSEAAVIGTAGIGGATFLATNPGDGNAIGFLMEVFNLPEGEAGTMYNRMYEYFTTVEDVSNGVNADMVLKEKTRAFFGDLGLDPAMTGTLLLFMKTLQTTKKLKLNTVKKMHGASQTEAEILFNYQTISQEQSISSAATDVNFKSNKLPAIYNKIEKDGGWQADTFTLEIGSGAGRLTDKFLYERSISNIKYDPYRLPEADNADAVTTINSMKYLRGGVENVVIANVLNVIPEEAVRIRVLQQAKYAVKPDGKVYIDSYNSGKEGITKQGYQLGKPNKDYIDEIESVFGEGSAKIKNGYIEVTPKIVITDPAKFDAVNLLDSIDPVITGTGGAGKNKVVISDILDYFDQAPKLDITNPEDFKKMVDQGVEEINYQLKQEITGAGWYDKDVKLAMKRLDDINPKFKDNAQIKDMVVFLTAIASPGQNVGMDFKVAAQIADTYLNTAIALPGQNSIPTGKFPVTNPNSLRGADDDLVQLGRARVGDEKGWTQRSHLKGQIEFVQKYVDQNGLDEFLNFLSTPTTRRQLNELRKSYDMKSVAGALDKEIMGADMFGPKVSKFMQNLLGISDENVPDIWFTRGFNRKSGNMYTIKKDGTKASADQPRNLSEREIMDNYINEVRMQLEETTGQKLTSRDTQAVLWYFEQGLYTKLGVKSEPKSYKDAAESIIKRKTDDLQRGVSQSETGNVEGSPGTEGTS